MEIQDKRLRKSLRILVAEDMPTIRALLISNLKSLGFTNIYNCNDGKQAWDTLCAEAQSNNSFDILLTDINMPKMTGIELIQKVRSSENFESMPILVISAINDREIIFKALKNGANNYILKPFDQETIKKKLIDIFYPPDS